MVDQDPTFEQRTPAIIKFVVPKLFDPCEVLPLGLWLRADSARYFLSEISRKRYVFPASTFTRLHSGILRRVLGDDYVRIKRALIAGGVIETTSHLTGVRSTGFRITKKFSDGGFIECNPVDFMLVNRVRRAIDDCMTISKTYPVGMRHKAFLLIKRGVPHAKG